MLRAMCIGLLLSPTLHSPLKAAGCIASAGGWAALASGRSANGYPDGDNSVTISGFACGPTREGVKINAANACQKSIGSKAVCEVSTDFNTGCAYVVRGSTPWGSSSFAVGLSPQQAYDKCRATGIDCETTTLSACVAPADPIPDSTIVPAPPITKWVALAGGTGYVDGKLTVRAGVGVGPTEENASGWARYLCAKDTNMSCQTISTFNSGCAYATSAKSEANRQVKVVYGLTKQSVLDQCTAGNFSCDVPIGRCAR